MLSLSLQTSSSSNSQQMLGSTSSTSSRNGSAMLDTLSNLNLLNADTLAKLQQVANDFHHSYSNNGSGGQQQFTAASIQTPKAKKGTTQKNRTYRKSPATNHHNPHQKTEEEEENAAMASLGTYVQKFSPAATADEYDDDDLLLERQSPEGSPSLSAAELVDSSAAGIPLLTMSEEYNGGIAGDLPMAHDRLFAQVPGRLSLLSNIVKYKVSIANDIPNQIAFKFPIFQDVGWRSSSTSYGPRILQF